MGEWPGLTVGSVSSWLRQKPHCLQDRGEFPATVVRRRGSPLPHYICTRLWLVGTVQRSWEQIDDFLLNRIVDCASDFRNAEWFNVYVTLRTYNLRQRPWQGRESVSSVSRLRKPKSSCFISESREDLISAKFENNWYLKNSVPSNIFNTIWFFLFCIVFDMV